METDAGQARVALEVTLVAEEFPVVGLVLFWVVVVLGVGVLALIAVLRTRHGAEPRAREETRTDTDTDTDTDTVPVMPTRRFDADDHSRIGPYRLHARLGAGGMGRVFLGTSPGGFTVAVKVVRPELADDPAFRRRFAAEVAAARRVGGFYTAQVVDADPDGDPPWLATAYIPGPSLSEAVRDYGPLPPASVAALGAGLAEGLVAVHAQRLVHRDLKPGNVILAADGPRVIDFGIARAMDAASATRASTALGTAAFMAPEQITGGEVGPACDVFALGCVLTYAATGRSPFGEGPAHAVTYRTVFAEPDLSGLPAALADLVGSCLAKDPAARNGLDRVLAALTADAPLGPGHGGGRWLPEAVTEDIALRRTRVLEPDALDRPPVIDDPGLRPRRRSSPDSAPGSGPVPVSDAGVTSGRAPQRTATATASAVVALLCLATTPVVPVVFFQAVDTGAVWIGSAMVQMAAFGVAAVVLAIGALLQLLRNPIGRWLIVAGGAGLALLMLSSVVGFYGLVGYGFVGILSLTVLTAAASAVLAALPSSGGRRPLPKPR